MSKFVVLLKFTEKGVANIQQSPDRAEAFRATALKMGVKVADQLWTAGCYDGLLVLDAPDDATAAALVLGLAKQDNLSTCMMPAYDAAGIKNILAKMK